MATPAELVIQAQAAAETANAAAGAATNAADLARFLALAKKGRALEPFKP